MVRVPDLCDYHARSPVMDLAATEEHSICMSGLRCFRRITRFRRRFCRGGGGPRLRLILVAGAQPHSDQPQVAVARRGRTAEVLLRQLRSVSVAGRCRRGDEDDQACDRNCLVVERDPIHTAKEVSTSTGFPGRFIFGIGAGWNEEEMANHGTAFATRFKLMRERIEAMKQIWTQSTAAFEGELSSSNP